MSRPSGRTIGWTATVLLTLATVAFGVQQVTQSSGATPTAASSAPAPSTSVSAPTTILPSLVAQASPTFALDHPAEHAGAAPCTEVRILSSLENLAMVRALAAGYQRSPRDVDGHCVHVDVAGQLSGVAATQARGGFSQLDAAHRPDIWLPDSSAWLHLARSTSVPTTAPSVGRSAVVLAMPVPLADALGWNRTPPSWATIVKTMETPDVWRTLGHPQWGSFKVGKASPDLATSGLFALASEFDVANKGPALTPTGINAPAELASVTDAELATSHYMSTPQHFLFHALEAEKDGSIATFLSAMFMDETTLWDWNRGDTNVPGMNMAGMNMDMTPSAHPSSMTPSSMTHSSTAPSGPMSSESMSPTMSDSMAPSPSMSGSRHSGTSLTAPAQQLVPIYPSDGVYMADEPAAVLHGSWISPAQTAAAQDFVRFARTAQGQQIVQSQGFRNIDGVPSPQVSSVAMELRHPHVLPTPDAAALISLQRSFPQVRKRARILFLLDVSGSMGKHIRPDLTKLQAAKHAVADALKYFSGSDRIGLAAFSNRTGHGLTPGLVSPVQPLATGKRHFLAALMALHPIAQTPLYSAVDRFATQLSHGFRPDDINAVIVLSDGHNATSDKTTKAQMLQTLRRIHARVPLLVFTLGYGHNSDTATLEDIASASGGHYFDATNPATVNQVLADELVTSF